MSERAGSVESATDTVDLPAVASPATVSTHSLSVPQLAPVQLEREQSHSSVTDGVNDLNGSGSNTPNFGEGEDELESMDEAEEVLEQQELSAFGLVGGEDDGLPPPPKPDGGKGEKKGPHNALSAAARAKRPSKNIKVRLVATLSLPTSLVAPAQAGAHNHGGPLVPTPPPPSSDRVLTSLCGCCTVSGGSKALSRRSLTGGAAKAEASSDLVSPTSLVQAYAGCASAPWLTVRGVMFSPITTTATHATARASLCAAMAAACALSTSPASNRHSISTRSQKTLGTAKPVRLRS